MTLTFTTPNGAFANAIRFSINEPDLTLVPFTMTLVSDYNKKQLVLVLTVVETNERFTEFSMDYTNDLGDLQFQGFWQYSITDSFDDVVDSGLVKFVNNQPDAVKNQPKHLQANDNGSTFIIY